MTRNNFNTTPPALADPLLPYTSAVQTYLSCSRPTADRLRNDGSLPAMQIGGRWMIKLSAITAFIAAAEAKAAASRKVAA